MKKTTSLLRCLGLAWVLLGLSPVWANPEFLVDSEWLSEHQADENLVILEVRYHPHRYYTIGHIPGAIQVQRFKDLGDNTQIPLMFFPEHQTFQQRLRRWGVNNDSTIVIYDDSRTALAARLYVMLELYGFNMQQVKILNGSTLEWAAFEDMSQEASATPQMGNVELKPVNREVLVEWTEIYDKIIATRGQGAVLIDARPHDHYTGKVIRHAARGGHIPGALNIVSLDGTDGQAQKWLDDEQLRGLYKEVLKDKPIYLYCHDGFRMSLAYLQLKHLGYEQVHLYNGGWAHWGSALELPVSTGNDIWGEDYDL